MKGIFKTFLYGAVMAFGTMFGIGVYSEIRDPVSRANIKRKVIEIKDTLFKKDGKS